MKRKTAMQELIEILKTQIEIYKIAKMEECRQITSLHLKTAEALLSKEKNNFIDFFKNGYICGYNDSTKTAEQYYIETYKQD